MIVDAGAAGIVSATGMLMLGAQRVIAGLESLKDWTALHEMVRRVGSERAVFSLDLWNGNPQVHPNASPEVRDASAAVLVDRALATGVGALVVIDLTTVGSNRGPSTISLVRELAGRHQVAIYAGGGVRGKSDVVGLMDAGARAVLVGTAIHAGIEGLGD